MSLHREVTICCSWQELMRVTNVWDVLTIDYCFHKHPPFGGVHSSNSLVHGIRSPIGSRRHTCLSLGRKAAKG